MPDTDTTCERTTDRWWDVAGWTRLLCAFQMSRNPARLALAVLGLVLTLGVGVGLDWVWVRSGGGVTVRVEEYEPATTPEAAQLVHTRSIECGVFELWWRNERAALLGCMASIVHGNFVCSLDSLAQGLDSSSFECVLTGCREMTAERLGKEAGLAGCVSRMAGGVLWMVREHPCFAVFFGLLSLAVWAFIGGAICRMNAVQFASGVRTELGDAVRFARKRWLGGFALGPLMPLLFVAIVGLLMYLGGVGMSVPWIGDLLGGLMFPLAIVGGFVVAITLVMTAMGVSLFWPAVAADDYDKTECAVHTLGYVGARPLRTVWLLFVAVVISVVSWLLVSLLAWFALSCTHYFVGAGTNLFTDRVAVDSGEGAGSKLDAVWSVAGVDDLFGATAFERKAHDGVSRCLVGTWVYLIVALVWAFLVNMWFGCCTAIYFLLRKEVDAIETSRVFMPQKDQAAEQPGPPDAPPAAEVEVPVSDGETEADSTAEAPTKRASPRKRTTKKPAKPNPTGEDSKEPPSSSKDEPADGA